MANITASIVLETGKEQLISIANSALNFSVVLESPKLIKEEIPFWEGDIGIFPKVDREGTISGTVKVQGILQTKSKVFLYFRKTGILIQSTFTDLNGAFSFSCALNRNVSDYFVVAITEQPFNAQVFDKITPA